MEKLTERLSDIFSTCLDDRPVCKGIHDANWDCDDYDDCAGCPRYHQMVAALNAYEATERTPEELQRLVDLQERGLLVDLPCLVNRRSVLTRHSHTGKLITIRYDTREEAEKALEGQE